MLWIYLLSWICYPSASVFGLLILLVILLSWSAIHLLSAWSAACYCVVMLMVSWWCSHTSTLCCISVVLHNWCTACRWLPHWIRSITHLILYTTMGYSTSPAQANYLYHPRCSVSQVACSVHRGASRISRAHVVLDTMDRLLVISCCPSAPSLAVSHHEVYGYLVVLLLPITSTVYLHCMMCTR